MIMRLKLDQVDEVRELLNQANDSSITHYSPSDVELFKSANTRNLIKKYIQDKRYSNFSYTVDNKIWWYLVYDNSISMFYRLYVHPDFQWKWIWSELIKYIKKIAIDLWKKSITVPSRDNAVSFYEKHWFIKTWEYNEWRIEDKIFQQSVLIYNFL